MRISKLKHLSLTALTFVVLCPSIQCIQIPERDDDFETVVKRGYYDFLDRVGKEIGSKLIEIPIEKEQEAAIVKNSEPGVEQTEITNKAQAESIQIKETEANVESIPHFPSRQQKERQAQELPKSERASRACNCKYEATLNTLHELMGSMLEFNSKILEDKERASSVLKKQFEFYNRVIGKQHLIDIQQREAAAKAKIEQACTGGYYVSNPNPVHAYDMIEKPFVSKEELSEFEHLNIEELANLAVCMRDIGSAIHTQLPQLEQNIVQFTNEKLLFQQGMTTRDQLNVAEREEVRAKLQVKNFILGILEKMRKYRLLAGKEHPRWDEFLKKSTS